MTDAEIVAEVRAALNTLNRQIAKAEQAGLTAEIEPVSRGFSGIGEAFPPKVGVSLIRRY